MFAKIWISTTALLFWACGQGGGEKLAGGEDFPNTIGKVVSEELAKSQNWNALEDLGSGPGLEESPSLEKVQAKPTQVLGKTAAENVMSFDYSDTASGWFFLFIERKEGDYLVSDTMKVLWDEQGRKDNDTANIVWNKSTMRHVDGSHIKRRVYSDLDGDSIVSGEPIYNGSALMVDETWSVDGSLQRSVMGVTAGFDRDFEAETDNDMLFFHTFALNIRGDTLNAVAVVDADGDSMVLRYGRDSSLVDFYELKKVFAGKSSFLKRTWTRMVIFPKDTLSNYPISFREEKVFENGSMQQTRIVKTSGDSLFSGGDTVIFHSEIRPGSGGVEDSSTLEITVLLDGALVESEALMLEFHARSVLAKGEEREIELSLIPESPLRDGEEPESGTLSVRLVYRDGRVLFIEGQMDTGIFTGTVTDAEGVKTPVSWDENGNEL